MTVQLNNVVNSTTGERLYNVNMAATILTAAVPLAVYFLSELTTDVIQIPWLSLGGHHTALKDWLFWWALAPRVGDNGGPLSSLIYALLYTGVWMGVAGMMRWRGVRFRV